jgi:predicted NUDIX family NTP pyrophosphohydrolase
MPRQSAGLLMYRLRAGELEFLLGHMGGPFWSKKDAGAWTMPKGELRPGEEPLVAACREFQEEFGFEPAGPFTSLGSVKQKGGKVVHAFSFSGDCDPASCKSNMFTLEWPPRSGKFQDFPELDRFQFFSLTEAHEKIHPAQAGFLDAVNKFLSR